LTLKEPPIFVYDIYNPVSVLSELNTSKLD